MHEHAVDLLTAKVYVSSDSVLCRGGKIQEDRHFVKSWTNKIGWFVDSTLCREPDSIDGQLCSSRIFSLGKPHGTCSKKSDVAELIRPGPRTLSQCLSRPPSGQASIATLPQDAQANSDTRVSAVLLLSCACAMSAPGAPPRASALPSSSSSSPRAAAVSLRLACLLGVVCALNVFVHVNYRMYSLINKESTRIGEKHQSFQRRMVLFCCLTVLDFYDSGKKRDREQKKASERD